jgi:hypothetical protein
MNFNWLSGVADAAVSWSSNSSHVTAATSWGSYFSRSWLWSRSLFRSSFFLNLNVVFGFIINEFTGRECGCVILWRQVFSKLLSQLISRA